MIAQVDPSLQVVKSLQVIALHSSILGDIGNSEPRVSSCQIISICRWTTLHVSGECWPYVWNSHWRRIWINLDDASEGDIEPEQYWFESELTQVSITYSQPHSTSPNAGGRFFLSSLQSTQWGFILHHCSIVSYIYPRGSEQLITKVDGHTTMNRWVS